MGRSADGESSGAGSASEAAPQWEAPPQSLPEAPYEVDPYAEIRSALRPDHAVLGADELTVTFGRQPALVTLHRMLASPGPQQASLAVLLGRAGRPSLRLNGSDVPLPSYLRVLSRLCREAAEQSEQDLGYAPAGRVGRGQPGPMLEWDTPQQPKPPTVDPFPAAFSNPLTHDDPRLTLAFNTALDEVKRDHAYHALPAVDDLAIIIVALNSDAAKTRPSVGRHYVDMFYSGSLLKIAAMYAAFQLRHAVNELAATFDPAKISNKIQFFAAVRKAFDDKILKASEIVRKSSSTGNRAPQYERIFDPTQDGAGKWSVAFLADPSHPKNDFAGHLKKMVVDSHDPSAGFCIQALGFSWINGLIQKAGWFDPWRTKHGIWLAGDYLLPAAETRHAHERVLKFIHDHPHDPIPTSDGNEEFELGISGWNEIRVPSDNDGPSKQATNCIDLARLLVLLADAKLVARTVAGAQNSANIEMLHMMNQAVSGAGAPSLVARSNPPPAFAILQSKIGVGELGKPGGSSGHFVNSEAMIVRQAGAPHREFVVVWQNVKDRTTTHLNRIRDIIQKTMDHY